MGVDGGGWCVYMCVWGGGAVDLAEGTKGHRPVGYWCCQEFIHKDLPF